MVLEPLAPAAPLPVVLELGADGDVLGPVLEELPDAPMPLVPVVELGLVAEPPVVLPVLEVRFAVVHPAASTAARVKPSHVAGRKVDLDVMKFPR